MSTPAFLATFVISDNTPDNRAIFIFFILLIHSLTMSIKQSAPEKLYLYETNYSYPMQALCSKSTHDNFSNLFSYFLSLTSSTPSFPMLFLSITSCLVCFDHPLCNPKHITFLISPPQHNVFKPFPFCFTFSLISSPPSFFLCF